MGTRLVVAIGVATVAIAWGATRPRFDVAEAAPGQAATAPAPQMQDMTKMHEQMMTEMKAGDAKLDALVKDMNAATGEPRVAAIAAVVTELVAQHKAMHGHMAQMHQHMMGGRGMRMGR